MPTFVTCCGAVTALVALLAAVLPFCTTIPPLPKVAAPLGTNLSDPRYDIVPVNAPAAAGLTLRILAGILKSPVGPLIARALLNDNQVWRLRELSLQVPEHILHRPVPVIQPTHEEHQQHAEHARLHGAQEASPKAKASSAATSVNPPPLRWSVRDYHDAYLARRTTPSAVAHALLAALPRLEAAVGTIFTEVQPEVVLAQALASDKRYRAGAPLSVWDGVPIGVKEMIEVKGHLMGDGSWRGTPEAPSRPVSTVDDPMVARMRDDGGAVVVGFTSMTEYGVTPLGWSAHAQGPRNPFATDRFSGGSSSGSAVAVAVGLVPMAIGFDGGGSIRIPAALTGVYGLATTFGRIGFLKDAGTSMTKTGPISATLADTALAYVWLATGTGSNNPSNAPPCPATGSCYATTTSHAFGAHAPPAHIRGWQDPRVAHGARIGIFSEYFDDASPEVRAAAHAKLDALVAAGATLVPIAVPNLRALALAHGIAISAEFSWAHDRETWDSDWPLEPSTHIQLALGRALTAVEVHAANRLRSWAIEYVGTLYRDHNLDAIVTPTTSRTAPPLPPNVADGLSDTSLVMSLVKHIFLANLLGLPALTVPIGVGNETLLPVGMQLLGAWWHEATLLRLANALDGDAAVPRPKHFFDELDGLLRPASSSG